MKKRTLVAIIAIVISSTGNAQQSTAPPVSQTIKGHSIGESFADFLSKEPKTKTGLAACHGPNEILSGFFDCKSLLGAEKGTGSVLTDADADFRFVEGKLSEINLLVNSTFDEAEKQAEEKFGKPVSRESTPMKNGFGATWSNRSVIWQTPALYAALLEDNNPASGDGRPFLTVSSRAFHDRQMQDVRNASKRALD